LYSCHTEKQLISDLNTNRYFNLGVKKQNIAKFVNAVGATNDGKTVSWFLVLQ